MQATHHEEIPVEMNVSQETAVELNIHKAIQFDDPHKAALEDSPDKPQRPSLSTLLAILFLALSAPGAITLPIVVVPSILLQIGTALGDVANCGWIAASWAIASSVSACIAGRLSDIFGRRYVLMSGQASGIVGGIIAATARSLSAAIAGSSLLGLSCGLILVVFTAIPELVPFKFRGLSLSFLEFVICLPWVASAVLLGNLLVIYASWRWCYIIATIYCTAAFIGTGIFYFPPARPRHDFAKTRWQEFSELDFLGLGLYSAGLTIFLIGLSWAGSGGHPWKSPSVIVPIILGVTLLCFCFGYDWILVSQEKAFFPLHLFKRFREFTLTLIAVFVSGMIYYSMSSLIPEATTYMFNNNEIQIGIISIPNGIGQAIGPTLGPMIMHFTKHPKWHIITALTIQGTFTALFAYAVPDHKAAWMAFQPLGQGCFTWISIAALVNIGLHVKHSELGLAAGLIATFRAAGGSVGDAIFGTILATCVDGQLAPRISQAALAEGYKASELPLLIPAVIGNAVGTPDAWAHVPGVTPVLQEATLHAFREAYAYAFKRVFYATIPFSIIAIIAALFIKDASKYITNHTAVVMEKNVLGKAPLYGVQERTAPSEIEKT